MSFFARFARAAPARIAPVGTDAASRLAALHAGAFARPWSPLDFQRLLGERGTLCDGLFLRGEAKPAGFVMSRTVLDEAEILTIAIAPEARGRGHAGPLLARHLDELSRRGVRRVLLEVEEGNAPALALYRKAGFREIGRRAGYYPKPDGSRACALAMAADL